MIKYFFAILFTISIFAQTGDLNNRYLLARSYEQAGELKKACEIYEDVFSKQPGNSQFFSSLNNIYVLLKDYSKSISLLSKRIEQYPEDVTLSGLLGVSYYLSGEDEAASAIWNNAALKFSNNEAYLRTLAGYALNVRAFDIAIDLFQKAKKTTGNKIFYAFELANLYSLTMQYKNAAEELAYVLELDPQQLYNVESRLYPYFAKFDAVSSFISVFEEKNPETNMNFAHLLGLLYSEAKLYDKSFEIYKTLDRTQNRQGNELLNFAQRVQNAGEINTALKIYDYLLTNYAASPIISAVKLNYAKTFEASLETDFIASNDVWKPVYSNKSVDKTKYEELISSYSEIIKLYPNSESAIESILRIGLIYSNKLNNFPEAVKNFSLIRTSYPMSRYYLDAVLNLGLISLKQGDLSNAESVFDNVILSPYNINQNKSTIKYYRALCYFFRSDLASARTLLDSLTKETKDNIANDALDLLLVFNSSMNDSLNLVRLGEAEYDIMKNNFEKAISSLRIINQSTQSFLLKDYTNFRIAELVVALDDYNLAVSSLKLALENNENNIYADKILFFIAEIYEFGIKDYKSAMKSLEELLMKYPNSIYTDRSREKIVNLRTKLS